MQFKSLLTIFAALPFVFSCSNDLDEEFIDVPQTEVTPNAFDESLFPVPDKSRALSYDPAIALRQLLHKFDEKKALVMGETKITDEQFAEIKKFVDENLKGENNFETYNNIFNWLYKTLKYVDDPDETAYVDPYDVFIHRACVCQGFANLMKTMSLTQGMPAMCVNGELIGVGGHAWNYIYVDKEWYVTDATNNMKFRMDDFKAYQNRLAPARTDLYLFEDENFCYNFYGYEFNVAKVKPSDKDYLVVPFGVAGYQLTQFCPQEPIDEHFTQLYIGRNIVGLGQYPDMVNQYFPNLQEIYVDSKNRKLESFNNIIYRKNELSPYFIPSSIKRVELKPMKVMEKNVIYNLKNVEEIVVADGTERMEDYCIEGCPKLQTVYVPKSVTFIAEKAIYKCNENVQIVRTSTGITEVPA